MRKDQAARWHRGEETWRVFRIMSEFVEGFPTEGFGQFGQGGTDGIQMLAQPGLQHLDEGGVRAGSGNHILDDPAEDLERF